MTITLKNITEEQLEKLLKATEDDSDLHHIYWQLRGYWMVGGDDDVHGIDTQLQ